MTLRTITLVFASLLVFPACGGITQFTSAQPFTIAGTAPPPAPARVQLRNNKIEFDEKIQFEANSSVIKDVSSSLLHEIAEVIRKNPQVTKISIEGHASSEGDVPPGHNKKLSDERAKAVMTYLIQKESIDASRLDAKGWGSEKPLASNDTEDGREKNRRVEFLVVDQATQAMTEKK